jgi:chemotaxis family two-component system response regulator Rcp1
MARRVLLSVEDDDSHYYLIKMAVEESGIPIHLCRVINGEEAIFFLEKTHGHELAPRPDLILLNMNLPRKTGFEVLTEIRASDSFRSIPVVIFTSNSDHTARNKALFLGAEDYISKPGTLTELLNAVTALCSRFLAPV